MTLHTFRLRLLTCALTAACAALPLAPEAFAQPLESGAPAEAGEAESAPETNSVVIWGRAIRLSGEAQAASEGIVGYADFDTRPLLRPGELVEVIPGMIATQHSGGGKANQYFLRGFNLDHGTDFAGAIDGVPLNLRSHAHMSGYLDLNFLIPDLVRSVEFRKGVHYADAGDYSAAGSGRFTTYDTLEAGFIQLDLSDHSETRIVGAGSVGDVQSGAVLAALQYETGDGPFERAEEIDKLSGMLKFTRELDEATLRLSLIGYDNSWFATDQIPLRAVTSGLVSRFGTLDPTLGGETSRYIASAAIDWPDAGVQVYAQRYTLDLYGNPTFNIDPVEGDQFVQVDDRWSWGARGHIERKVEVGALPVTFRGGADIHADIIDEVALYKTSARQRTGTIRRDEATVTLADLWGDAAIHWTDRFRTTLGLRVDHVIYDVTALQPENSGDGDGSQVSPKFSAAWRLNDAVETYAAIGRGFHTNDPRGVALTVDPATGDPAEPVSLFATSTGGEIGVRVEPSGRFNASLAAFLLDLDSELVFVGDAGTSEPSDATRRMGVETSLFWQALDHLVIDAQAAWSRARFRNAPDGEDRVPNSVELVIGAGATWLSDDGWEASLRVRHLGEAQLIEDGSQVSDPTTIVNLGLARTISRFKIGVDVLNLLDAADNDITYFYESQLPGEAAPVEDIHFHPVHPRAVRLTLRTRF